MSRINHIDTARGIAILLVVLGHCFHSAEAPFNRFILSFHMPLFFYLSGVFAKSMSKNTLVGGVLLKARRLLVPQITLSITIILLKGGLWISEGKSLSEFDWISCFGYWFLPVLFICSVIFMVVSTMLNIEETKNRIAVGIVSLLVAFAVVYTNVSSRFVVIDWLIKSSVAVFFYFCGAFSKDMVLSVKQKSDAIHGLFIMVLLSVLLIISQLNIPVKMYQNEYGLFPLFMVSSFLGILITIEISKKLANTAFLIIMGRLSIAVYVWNFLIVGIMLRVINNLMKRVGIDNDGIFTAAVFGCSLLVVYAIAKFTYNRFPIIYGVNKV